MDGVVGMKISNINQYDYLDAGKSGVQKNPGADSLPADNCFWKQPDVNLSNDENISKGISLKVPMCKTIFKRLSWREIKSGYSD